MPTKEPIGGWIVRLTWGPGHQSLHGLFTCEEAADFWAKTGPFRHHRGFETEFLNVDPSHWTKMDDWAELLKKRGAA